MSTAMKKKFCMVCHIIDSIIDAPIGGFAASHACIKYLNKSSSAFPENDFGRR